MKKVLYFFIGCIVVGFIGSLFISTVPAFEIVGTSFLLNLKQGNYQPAYSIFTDDYKKRHQFEDFKTIITSNRLNQYKDVKWLKTLTRPDKVSGYVLGEVQVEGGQKIPLELQFLKIKNNSLQGGGWFVDDMFIGQEVIDRQAKGYQ